MRWPFVCIAGVLVAGCVAAPPSTTTNLCRIFYEKSSWYDAADSTYQRWGTPIRVQMAIIDQESGFVGDARPPRRHLFWFIPWTRISSAYGYTQALDGTWAAYQRASGNGGADRDSFADAADFVGWYVNRSHHVLGIPKGDAYRQYLAYYVGQAGYRRGDYRGKPWLGRTARRVGARARRYGRQLRGCRASLEHPGHWWWPF